MPLPKCKSLFDTTVDPPTACHAWQCISAHKSDTAQATTSLTQDKQPCVIHLLSPTTPGCCPNEAFLTNPRQFAPMRADLQTGICSPPPPPQTSRKSYSLHHLWTTLRPLDRSSLVNQPRRRYRSCTGPALPLFALYVASSPNILCVHACPCCLAHQPRLMWLSTLTPAMPSAFPPRTSPTSLTPFGALPAHDARTEKRSLPACAPMPLIAWLQLLHLVLHHGGTAPHTTTALTLPTARQQP